MPSFTNELYPLIDFTCNRHIRSRTHLAKPTIWLRWILMRSLVLESHTKYGPNDALPFHPFALDQEISRTPMTHVE